MLHITLFIIISIILVSFSWQVLKNPKSHGFYRFFAFEAILALMVLNEPYWFNNPISQLQLASWFLLILSVVFVIQALILFKKFGGSNERQDTPENFAFENTVNIVENGLYRFVRHPMYSSLLFLGWGAFLKNITTLNIVLVIAVTILLVIVAKIEEGENIQFFGSKYSDYMKRTKMFVPWLL